MGTGAHVHRDRDTRRNIHNTQRFSVIETHFYNAALRSLIACKAHSASAAPLPPPHNALQLSVLFSPPSTGVLKGERNRKCTAGDMGKGRGRRKKCHPVPCGGTQSTARFSCSAVAPAQPYTPGFSFFPALLYVEFRDS